MIVSHQLNINSIKIYFKILSSFVVQIGFEEISYIVDESAGLVRLVVIVLDGANVFTSGTIERVLVLLTTHTGTALGKRRYFTINFILI